MNLRALLMVVWVGFSAGCGDTKPQPDPAATAKPTATAKATSTATAKATATAAATAAAGARGKMTHCPSVVDGAKTVIEDVDGGVVVTVTGGGADAAKEIRERAKYLVEAAKTDPAGVRHDGTGQGGGALGRCPIVNRNTSVEAADVEGGSKVTVKVKKADEVDWLRRESRERLAALSEPGVKEAGQGKMVHCPNTVEGATSTLKEGKDSVGVVVTAKDAAKTDEIRARAKHVVEASKKDPTGVEHKGDGSGGGGLGRCPVVLKDTTLVAKDVEGGSEIVMTPADKTKLDALVKEVKDRLERLPKP